MNRAANAIDQAMASYRDIQGYRATIRSKRADGGEIIRYAWQRPGRIRMEFETPHKGALLIYDPDDKRVRLWPFGKGLLPPMNLAPDNPLILSPSGQRVDRSDVGALLDNIRALLRDGVIEEAGSEKVDGKRATHVVVTGNEASSERPGPIHRYDVWLDAATRFPLKVVSSDAAGKEIESVLLEQVELDPEFPPRFFSP